MDYRYCGFYWFGDLPEYLVKRFTKGTGRFVWAENESRIPRLPNERETKDMVRMRVDWDTSMVAVIFADTKDEYQSIVGALGYYFAIHARDFSSLSIGYYEWDGNSFTAYRESDRDSSSSSEIAAEEKRQRKRTNRLKTERTNGNEF